MLTMQRQPLTVKLQRNSLPLISSGKYVRVCAKHVFKLLHFDMLSVTVTVSSTLLHALRSSHSEVCQLVMVVPF